MFGKPTGFGDIDLSTLSADQGFIIQGDVATDYLGTSVSSAGDINGDGFDDVVVGNRSGNDGGSNASEAYVVFGGPDSIGSLVGSRQVVDLTFLAADQGFIIQGDSAGDQAGWSVSYAGDINGDGFADIIVGAIGGDDGGPGAGEAYVIFGSSSGFGVDVGGRQVIDLTTLNATQGFIIQGDINGDQLGWDVSGAEDVNNDGFGDLIVGARGGDDGGPGAGEAYVVFGGTGTFGINIGGRQVVDLTTLAPIHPNLTTSGTLTFDGVDFDDTHTVSFVPVGGGVGYLGTFSATLNTDTTGSGTGGLIDWDFLVNDEDLNPLSEGEVRLQEYDVTVTDSIGVPLFDTQRVTVAINGKNDLATVSSESVSLDETDVPQTAGGILTSSDIDNPDNVFTASTTIGTIGSLSINTAGAWTFNANSAFRSLDFGENVSETYTITSVDGTPSTVQITINGFGLPDAMELGDVVSGDVVGISGYAFAGLDTFDFSGVSVSSAGDVNGDGFDDLLIGAYFAEQPGGDNVEGETYLVFGGVSNLEALDTLGGAADDGIIDLAALEGLNNTGQYGFVLAGADATDNSGKSVSAAGDLNGDGIADLLIGAHRADATTNVNENSGETYVVFGGVSNLDALDTLGGAADDGVIDLAALAGANNTGQHGFVLQGVDVGDQSGTVVSSAGDVNDDGVDDLIIGAPFATMGSSGSDDGEIYLVFGDSLDALDTLGGAADDGVIDLGTLEGANNTGEYGYVFAGFGQSGRAIASAGDVDGDGIADLIIENNLVFGGTVNLEALDTLGGAADDGVIDLPDIAGVNNTGQHGFAFSAIRSVSSAGDVNGDGFDDILIGGPAGSTFQGSAYLVFGGVSSLQTLDTFNGAADDGVIDLSVLEGPAFTNTYGFAFAGIDAYDNAGTSVSSAGDLNGDGFDDLLISAPTAELPGGDDREGETYVVFGGQSNLITLNLLDGSSADGIQLSSLLNPGMTGDSALSWRGSMATTLPASRYRPPATSMATASTIF